MKSIYGSALALVLSLTMGMAQTDQPAAQPAETPAPVPTAPAPAPEIAPAPKVEKPAAKKSSAKPKSRKPDTHTAIDPAEPAVVKRDNANVRGRSSFIGEVITKLKKGEPVTLHEEITLGQTRKDEPARWYKISMPANTPVWVSALFIDPSSKTVTANKLQVRAGPGENFSVVGALPKGATIKQIRQVNDWIEIETPADTYAFVAADLIERSAPTAPAPTPTPEPAPEVVAVPPDVSNRPTPAEPAAPETTPEVAPVVTPAPAEEEPLPKRIVTREGIVRRSYNVQTPSYFELESPDTKRVINYLYSSQPDFTLKDYVGKYVIVTGEEYVDKRWKNTPVIEIESLEQQ